MCLSISTFPPPPSINNSTRSLSLHNYSLHSVSTALSHVFKSNSNFSLSLSPHYFIYLFILIQLSINPQQQKSQYVIEHVKSNTLCKIT